MVIHSYAISRASRENQPQPPDYHKRFYARFSPSPRWMWPNGPADLAMKLALNVGINEFPLCIQSTNLTFQNTSSPAEECSETITSDFLTPKISMSIRTNLNLLREFILFPRNRGTTILHPVQEKIKKELKECKGKFKVIDISHYSEDILSATLTKENRPRGQFDSNIRILRGRIQTSTLSFSDKSKNKWLQQLENLNIEKHLMNALQYYVDKSMAQGLFSFQFAMIITKECIYFFTTGM